MYLLAAIITTIAAMYILNRLYRYSHSARFYFGSFGNSVDYVIGVLLGQGGDNKHEIELQTVHFQFCYRWGVLLETLDHPVSGCCLVPGFLCPPICLQLHSHLLHIGSEHASTGQIHQRNSRTQDLETCGNQRNWSGPHRLGKISQSFEKDFEFIEISFSN
jgi:hypothetical protein